MVTAAMRHDRALMETEDGMAGQHPIRREVQRQTPLENIGRYP
ncbi:MAG TPA: hypothetical protein VLK60_05835 [Variovorax sp.]|nr:hypothetical protein [Variovorax sp.]